VKERKEGGKEGSKRRVMRSAVGLAVSIVDTTCRENWVKSDGRFPILTSGGNFVDKKASCAWYLQELGLSALLPVV